LERFVLQATQPLVGGYKGGTTVDVAVEKGKIAAVARGGDLEGERILPCHGALLLMGVTDLHVHARDFEEAEKDTVQGVLKAASKGGFTRIVAMPNTRPPLSNVERIKRYKELRGQDLPAVEMEVLGAAQDETGKLVEPERLLEAGVAGFSDDARPLCEAPELKAYLKQVARTGLRFFCHCEKTIPGKNGALDERIAWRYQVPGLAPEAEVEAAELVLEAAAETGAKVHLHHVSCAGTLELVRQAKRSGVEVTCEATPHHVSFSFEDIEPERATYYKMNPPLRSPEDVAALKEGLKDGTVDAFATDHAPHTLEEKARLLMDAPFGITGLETALALTYRLVREEVLDFSEFSSLWCEGPARVLGREGKRLEIGQEASLTLFSPGLEWRFEGENVGGKASNSPLKGKRLLGKVVFTYAGGEILHLEETCVNE